MTFDAAWDALLYLLTWPGPLLLVAGVLIGSIFGLIPGLSGVTAVALLLPLALVLGEGVIIIMVAALMATQTSNTFAAVLFNIPGTPTAAATLFDGYPMARRGQAARALSAAFVASASGGVIAAAILTASIPLMRPLVLAVGSPERLALIVIGVLMIGLLSTGQAVKGLVAALIGFLVAIVGFPPASTLPRFTFDVLYLVGGVPLVPLTLGLFGLAEILDFMGRARIADRASSDDPLVPQQIRQGIVDNIRQWVTVLRGGLIGSAVGAVPGLGGTAAAFFAYAYQKRRRPNADPPLGEGNVEGVIAPEASNNASQAAELVPTLAFGVPGGPSTAILLGVFVIAGFQPGTPALTTQLPFTLSIIWTVVIANLIAVLLCFVMLRPFAALASVRSSIMAPMLMVFVLIGSIANSGSHWDLVVTLVFGALGYYMSRNGWPRAPLLVAFVLGGLAEQFFVLSYGNYGWSFLLRPLVLAILAIPAMSFLGWLGATVLRRAVARGAGSRPAVGQ